MPDIGSIVNVSISAQTKTVSRAGFGTPLILSSEATTKQTPTAAEYASVDEMLTTNGGPFASTDKVVAIATRLFAQSPAPQKVVVGKRGLSTQRVTLAFTAAELTAIAAGERFSRAYTFTINGQTYTYTSGAASTTASEFTEGIEATINGDTPAVGAATTVGTAPVLATETAGVLVSIDGADAQGGTSEAGVFFDLASVDRTVFNVQDISDASVIDTVDLAANLLTVRTAIDGNDDWYGLITDTHGKEDIADLANSASISGEDKYFFASSPDSDIIASGSSDVASTLQAASVAKVNVFYHPEASTYSPEAAWAGGMLPRDPGSATWKFKTLTGVPTTNLTSGEANQATGKNAAIYVEVGGVGITCDGKGADGEFIDIERFIAFLTARMQENVFTSMVNLPKLPYTADGLGIVESRIRQTLQLGIRVGGLAPNPAPTVTIPDIDDISDTDKANRELNNVTFTAVLAGAIHKVTINGTLTV